MLVYTFFFLVTFSPFYRDTRIFLRSFVVGDEFQKLKQLMSYFLESKLPQSPEDTRLTFPYLFLSFSNRLDSNFRLRQYLFNLEGSNIKPFLPPSILTLD